MFVRINSHRARDSIERHQKVKVIDWHYYSERGIFHIQEIPDGTDVSKIKGVTIVKRMPKEELYLSSNFM